MMTNDDGHITRAQTHIFCVCVHGPTAIGRHSYSINGQISRGERNDYTNLCLCSILQYLLVRVRAYYDWHRWISKVANQPWIKNKARRRRHTVVNFEMGPVRPALYRQQQQQQQGITSCGRIWTNGQGNTRYKTTFYTRPERLPRRKIYHRTQS